MQSVEVDKSASLTIIQPKSNSPAIVRLSSTFRSPSNSNRESNNSNKVSEVMSPQVSQERMGSLRVTDLLRYHSLVEDFGRLADCWMAAGQLRGLANVGGGYLLDLQIPLSGEEGGVLLGGFAREENEADPAL